MKKNVILLVLVFFIAASVSATAQAAFTVVGGDTTQVGVSYSTEGSWTNFQFCSLINGSNSVLRKIRIWEIDWGDFEKAKITCSAIAAGGELETTSTASDLYFDTTSDGVTTAAEVPSGLPVMITTEICDGFLTNYSIHTMTALHVLDHETIPDDGSGFATDSNGLCLLPDLDTLKCPPGSVIDGFGVKWQANAHGTKAKIHGIKIQCRELSF